MWQDRLTKQSMQTSDRARKGLGQNLVEESDSAGQSPKRSGYKSFCLLRNQGLSLRIKMKILTVAYKYGGRRLTQASAAIKARFKNTDSEPTKQLFQQAT